MDDPDTIDVEIVRGLSRALDPEGVADASGIKGRSSDDRQDAYHAPDIGGVPGDLDPNGWLVTFPADRHADTDEQHRGTLPMAVVGHEALSDGQWGRLIEALHDRSFPDQVYPADTPDGGVDIHHLAERGGDYEAAFRVAYPKSREALERLADLAGRLVYHPMSHVHLRPMLTGDGVYASGELYDEFLEVAEDKLKRDPDDSQTMGDILNRISHPFGTTGLY